jgi:hypothetical protein
LSKNMSKEEIDRQISQILKEERPETVDALVMLVQRKLQRPEKEIRDRILYLEVKNKIRFKPEESLPAEKLGAYLRSNEAYWYWTVLILASITALLVFVIPDDAVPFVYARNVLGVIFVIWLPGYTLIKTLFPRKELDNTERAALSLGTSIALIPLVGLLLNYSPWGIRPVPSTLSLLALAIAFATTAIVREHQTRKSK